MQPSGETGHHGRGGGHGRDCLPKAVPPDRAIYAV